MGGIIIIKYLHLENGGHFTVAHTHPLDRILNHMHEELINDPINGNIYASACVPEFIMEFARQCGIIVDKDSGEAKIIEEVSQYDRHMKAIASYVDYHYMHKITMAELCELIGVTPQHMCRIIKKSTGMKPIE